MQMACFEWSGAQLCALLGQVALVPCTCEQPEAPSNLSLHSLSCNALHSLIELLSDAVCCKQVSITESIGDWGQKRVSQVV